VQLNRKHVYINMFESSQSLLATDITILINCLVRFYLA